MASTTRASTPSTNTDPERVELIKSLFNNEAASEFRKNMRANGLYEPRELNYNSQFYRFRRIDPHYFVEGGIEYLFFTKPDLNLLGNDGKLLSQSFTDQQITGIEDVNINGGPAAVPYFQMLMRNGYTRTFSDLCYSYSDQLGHGKCPFVRILSNRKVSNMDVPDITVQELETSQNMYGSRLFYPTSSMKSDEDFEFGIEFEDTQFLEVYHFFKAYDVYRQMKWLGLISPSPVHIMNKILHDHMSVYKFIVDIDGETLLYWAKAIGVYPKTISRSAFSEFQDKGQLKINVNFKCSGWFEDMDPMILVEFNELVSSWVSSFKESPIYDDSIQRVSGDNLDYFYIKGVPHNVMKDLGGEINVNGYGKYYLIGGKL